MIPAGAAIRGDGGAFVEEEYKRRGCDAWGEYEGRVQENLRSLPINSNDS